MVTVPPAPPPCCSQLLRGDGASGTSSLFADGDRHDVDVLPAVDAVLVLAVAAAAQVTKTCTKHQQQQQPAN